MSFIFTLSWSGPCVKKFVHTWYTYSKVLVKVFLFYIELIFNMLKSEVPASLVSPCFIEGWKFKVRTRWIIWIHWMFCETKKEKSLFKSQSQEDGDGGTRPWTLWSLKTSSSLHLDSIGKNKWKYINTVYFNLQASKKFFNFTLRLYVQGCLTSWVKLVLFTREWNGFWIPILLKLLWTPVLLSSVRSLTFLKWHMIQMFCQTLWPQYINISPLLLTVVFIHLSSKDFSTLFIYLFIIKKKKNSGAGLVPCFPQL